MKLKDALEKGRFVVTSEVQTPIDEDPQELIKRLELVRGRVDGVTVPELEVEGIEHLSHRPLEGADLPLSVMVITAVDLDELGKDLHVPDDLLIHHPD